jgi:hypothetical protein
VSGTTPQAEKLRASLALLTAKAISDLRQLVKFDTAAAAREQLIRLLPELVHVYGSAASSVSADWYEELRLEVGPKQRFTPVVPVMDAAKINAQTEVLARWAVKPLAVPEPVDLAPAPTKVEPDPEAAASLASGGLERAILNESRAVLTTAAVDDPAAHGWQRAGHGECAFCAMLIGRGAVYTRGSVDFGAHNNCRCTAVPAWGGRELPVKPYVPTSHNITAADRKRVRKYLRENFPDHRG